MKTYLISYFLCGNLQNNFGSHKAQKNLGLEAVKWKIVTKVGVAPHHPTCFQMRNISPCRCLNPLRSLIFDSGTADEPVSHAKPHVALRKTVAHLLGRTTQCQLRKVGISAKYLVECFIPLPKNRYSAACLLVIS